MSIYNVFLDTSEFIGGSYNFESKKFLSLSEKVRNGTVKVYITDVVRREVENNISKNSEQAYTEIKTFRASKSARFIKHLSSPPIKNVFSLTQQDIQKALLKAFETYQKSAAITIISTDNVKVSNILALYFNKLPPFSESKKSEFPDAINLVALQDWCKVNDQKMYVVSRDPDLKEFCENNEELLNLSDLSELLQIVTTEEKNNNAKFLHKFIENNLLLLEVSIENLFNEIDITATYYDSYVEVTDFSVESVDILSWHIISANKNGITLDIKAEISFDVNASVEQVDSGDDDDDRETNVEVEETITIEGTLDYLLTKAKPKVWEDLQRVYANLKPDTIEIDLKEFDFD